MRSPLHFTSSRAVTLIEAVVGGALILLAGYLLNSSSAESVKMRKSLDENIIMRRILDYTAAEISRNGGIFLAMEHSGSKIQLYYACYSDQGTLQANRQGDVEYGIFTAKKPREAYATAEQLTPEYLKEHKFGFAATKPLQPCEDSRYIAYALPIDLNGSEITYLAHIWVYSLIAGEEIKSALADSAVITPI